MDQPTSSDDDDFENEDDYPMDDAKGKPGSSKSDSKKWMKLFKLQNAQFMDFVKTLSQNTPSSSVSHNYILPEFDPKKEDMDGRMWCNTVDLCFAEAPLVGGNLIIALSKALKGEASSWLTQISFMGMTWVQFKELFLSRFDSPEPTSAVILNMMNGKPRVGENLAAYAGRLLSTVSNSLRNFDPEKISVALVLAHIAQLDQQVQTLAFTKEIDSRDTLLRELKAVSFRKRNQPSTSEYGDHKRPRFANPGQAQSGPNPLFIKCSICGRANHKVEDCKFRNKSENDSQNALKRITCYKCNLPGHMAHNCTRVKPAEKKEDAGQNERKVEFCSVNPTGSFVHGGETYEFTFDSGSECSLIKEVIAHKFSGPQFHDLISMTGIGKSKVDCKLQILSKITINNINLEVLFHVLPDEFLSRNILIGREVLAGGLGVSLSADQCRFEMLLPNKEINACSEETMSDSLPININTDLSDVEKPKLLSLLKRFANFFADGYPKTRVTTGQLEIRLIDPNLTVQRRPYRLGPNDRETVRKIVKDLESAGIIRPSCSPFASPVILVRKKNGTHRLCVDYRELNSNTVPDRFPLPLIEDQVARLGGSHFLTCLDMASGFHQIPVHPESIEKTAFVTPDGQWEYLATPFGLRNAPSVYQRCVLKALGDLAYQYVVSYMDDLVIIASTIEQALERLETVLTILSEAGFSLNLSKCSFIKTKIEFLGYKVSDGHIQPNARKIEALTQLQPPRTATDVRRFIGLASYFRQFVPKFSEIMAPLYKLTSSKGNIQWLPDHESVRQIIISKLTSEPILMIFDPQYPIELHTDACSIGLGAMLLHKVDGRYHVVAYFSKRTSSAEAIYPSYHLETLAVVKAVQQFQHFLQGREFTVVTDCNSLKASRKKKDLLPQAQRWWAYLQSFDFEIVHRPGDRMAHVDFLSRYPLHVETDHVSEKKEIVRTPQKQVDFTELPGNWLQAEQQQDEEISLLVSKFNNGDMNEDVRKSYEMRSGVLYRNIQRNGRTRCLPIVPRTFRWSVINNVHESIMHLGWEKTLEKVYEHYWFENMSKYVRRFVEHCITCQVSKSHSGKVQAELHPIPKVSIPWQTIHVDATGKLSGKNDTKEYALVFIDAFTKFVLLHHTYHINSASCVKALKANVALFGAPTRIIADQGRCFSGKDFKEFCETHNIQLHLIATGSSRANGQVERVMSTLKNMLTAAEVKQDCSWQEALGDVQLALNCTVNRVTQFSPMEMMFGKTSKPLSLVTLGETHEPVNVSEIREKALERINKASSYDKARFDSTKAKVAKLSVGDLALIQNEERNQTKLAPKYKGPFQVIEVLDGDRYVLKSFTSNRTYKYAHDRVRKVPAPLDPVELEVAKKKGSYSDQSSNESSDEN